MYIISIGQLLVRAGIREERIPSVLIKLHPPNPRKSNQDPVYLSGLLERARLTDVEAAALIGITTEEMKEHLLSDCPYPVQYCLEALAQIHSS